MNERLLRLMEALCFTECRALACEQAGRCCAGSEGPQWHRKGQAMGIIQAQQATIEREHTEWVERNRHMLSAGHLNHLK